MTASTDTASRPARVQAILDYVERARLRPWTPAARRLAMIITLLTIIGLVMSFSASFVDAAQSGDPFVVFRRQLLWAALGVPVFMIAATLPPVVWRRAAPWLMSASVVALVVVLIPGLGVVVDGARRWIDVGPIRWQPSEIAKLGMALWLAHMSTRKREWGVDLTVPRNRLMPALPALGLMGLLVMLQPDLGTTLLLCGIAFLVLWIDGLPLRYVGASIVAIGMFGAIAAQAAPYRMARILGWWRPEDDPLGNGFQLLQSLYAMGNGGVFGIGLGSSRGKWNFIPNPETDFIFAIIGEELGLVGALVVLGLFFALLLQGIAVARNVEDVFARILAFTITSWLVGQALINIGAVTGLLPITGVTLPLVSVGGSSLVTTLLSLGILVSVARSPQLETRQEPR